MIGSLLVANREEIARRVVRTARALGVRSVALHADVDADLPHVREADEAVALPGPAAYRDVDAVLAAARSTGAEAVHPGYGFLAESPAFARACAKDGLLWVGPDPESMELLADKVAARNHVAARGVPVLPGTHYRYRQGQTVGEGFDAVGRAVEPLLAAGLESIDKRGRH